MILLTLTDSENHARFHDFLVRVGSMDNIWEHVKFRAYPMTTEVWIHRITKLRRDGSTKNARIYTPWASKLILGEQ